MKNAFTQTRKWMMAKYDLSEFETWTIITQAVNFGVTQLVDGNWGMHALIPKSIFEGVERNAACNAADEIFEEDTEEAEEDIDTDAETDADADVDTEVDAEVDTEVDADQIKESAASKGSLGLHSIISFGVLFATFFK